MNILRIGRLSGVLDTRDGTSGVTGSVGAARTIALNLSAKVPTTATYVTLSSGETWQLEVTP